MPAPDNLQTQTPGQLTPPTAEQTNSPAETSEPEYTAKFNGGPRWRIWSRTANDWFSDFVATGEGNKEAALAEAERLNAGGEPFVKDAEPEPVVAVTPPAATQPTAEQAQRRTQAVLTDEGWLVPDLPVAFTRE